MRARHRARAPRTSTRPTDGSTPRCHPADRCSRRTRPLAEEPLICVSSVKIHFCTPPPWYIPDRALRKIQVGANFLFFPCKSRVFHTLEDCFRRTALSPDTPTRARPGKTGRQPSVDASTPGLAMAIFACLPRVWPHNIKGVDANPHQSGDRSVSSATLQRYV